VGQSATKRAREVNVKLGRTDSGFPPTGEDNETQDPDHAQSACDDVGDVRKVAIGTCSGDATFRIDAYWGYGPICGHSLKHSRIFMQEL
jgi:hypothetical protein